MATMIFARAAWKANGALSPGQAKRHPGFTRVGAVAPCKGKSITMCFGVLPDNNICITKILHATKKVYNLYTNICSLPVSPLVKECLCFYCHLTLFVRNKLIYIDFKSVRWFQNILHAPAYILHTLPRSLAVGFVVCGGLYVTGTQKNQSEQQTFLFPYAVISFSRACAVWQRVGCVGCV